MEKTDKYKTVAALVRCFFGAFSAGIIDCHVKDYAEKLRPIVVKKTMLEHYEAVGRVFNDTMFYPLAYLNYTMDGIESELRKLDMSHATMTDLVRLACRTDALHKALVTEYKRNFTALLGGRVPGVAEHLRLYTRGKNLVPVDTDMAISLCVRTTMTAYARGIRQAATGKASLHQATLYRLLLEAMTTLLHDRPLQFADLHEDDGLEPIFMRACRSEHNFAVMTGEMDRTYTDLVKSEGIIAQDDTAN